jgi:predicted AAA+ superfamily ATPase
MFRRTLNPLKTNSFLLFGARGTGKSTLIRDLLAAEEVLEVNLLDPLVYEQATLGLKELIAKINSAAKDGKWIFIDEVQRSPKLLDVAQSLIDTSKTRFALSGSSARKLKRGGANLLAGRAYSYSLFPLNREELGDSFNLDTYLAFGGLPHVWNIHDDRERVLYLRTYVATYLKEEIAEEQIVRKLEPFSKFLQVAAQSSGKILNYSKIARDVGASDQTVKTYFQILEDTLLGHFLPAYDSSIRRSIGKTPKFYFFDTGVLRALTRTVDQPLLDSNYLYGSLFEHFIINQIRCNALYNERDYQFSFIRTPSDEEVDLIIERPGKPTILVEIKSTTKIKAEHTATILNMSEYFKDAELYLLSRDPEKKQFGNLCCMHWEEGIVEVVR